MQKSLLALILLAPLSAVLAQENAEPAPNIVVNEPVFNFGEKDESLSVEHTFEILNDGDLSLVISKTKTSCGCTVANISRKIIPPGETATLKAVFNLKNKRGNQAKNITIHCNDPDSPTFQLRLEGTVTSSLTINPERVFLSGISADSDVTRTVDIQSEKSIVVKGIQNPLSQIDASLETLREGHEYRLTVRTKPPLSLGRFQNHIRLETEPANQPNISVLVMGDVVGPLAFAPQQIVINGPSTNALTRYVVVRPGSQKNFSITKIELPNEEMQSKIFPMGANGFRIQLMNIVPQTALNGGKVIIHTDAEAMPRVEIPFVVQEGNPAA